MIEEPPHVFGTHGRQCFTHGLDEGLLGAGAGLPEKVLYLREGFLYRVEIRRVGGQVDELASAPFDEIPNPLWPMGSEVVHHYNLTGLQSGS